jgi:hypothetical protein
MGAKTNYWAVGDVDNAASWSCVLQGKRINRAHLGKRAITLIDQRSAESQLVKSPGYSDQEETTWSLLLAMLLASVFM